MVSMYPTGYVPYAEQLEDELVRMQRLSSKRITNPKKFMTYFDKVLDAMNSVGIRHGDLTLPHVFVVENKPKIIDWGESRVACDPRLDKRREGDKFWLNKTMKEMMTKNGWNKQP
ncbi:MAG: hypothetical protein ACW99G_17070 [Candidatus Thorarchaeota archaeon]